MELAQDELFSTDTATLMLCFLHHSKAICAPLLKCLVTSIPESSTTTAVTAQTLQPSPFNISAGILGMLRPASTSGQTEITIPEAVYGSRILSEAAIHDVVCRIFPSA
jgi:hypothetical protein